MTFTAKQYTAKELYDILSKTVIGQEVFLKKLANTIWLHNKRIQLKSNSGKNRALPKHNLLCVGPTGSGKTLAVQTLADICGFDTAVFNAEEFTGTGWRGRDVDEIISELYHVCGKNKARTERAVVILDEIDKMILKNRDERDPSFCAANAMLKLIEGTEVRLDECTINTGDILFIATGAFEGIENIIQKRVCGAKEMGFQREARVFMDEEKEDIYSFVRREDLIKYGAGAQFLGRFSDIATLRRLRVPELVRVLTESDKSLVKGMDELLECTCNAEVILDEAGARAVAGLAYQEGTGARGLSQVVMSTLEDILFGLDTKGVAHRITITADENGLPVARMEKMEDEKKRMQDNGNTHISCHNNRNAVEKYVDYILGAVPDYGRAGIRKIRGAHALLCCIVFYQLAECCREKQTLQVLESIVNEPTPVENPKLLVSFYRKLEMDAKEGVAMDYCFYYEKFQKIDPQYESVELARMAVDRFIQRPVFCFQTTEKKKSLQV